MMKKFSKREGYMIFALVLIVIGLVYYRFVYTPITESIATNELELADAQTLVTVESGKAAKLQQMRTEIEEFKANMPADEGANVPDYDNTEQVARALFEALKGTREYSIEFGEIVFEDTIVERNVNISFTATSYAEAKRVITNIYGGDYSCAISNFTVLGTAVGTANPNIARGNVTISMTVTYFEYLNI